MDGNVRRINYRIEPKPGGGYIGHGDNPNMPVIEGATHEEVEQKLKEMLLQRVDEQLGKLHLGGLSLSLHTKISQTHIGPDGTVTTSTTVDGVPQPGAVAAFAGQPGAGPQVSSSSAGPIISSSSNSSFSTSLGGASSGPITITANTSGGGQIVKVLLALLIGAVLLYFLLHQ